MWAIAPARLVSLAAIHEPTSAPMIPAAAAIRATKIAVWSVMAGSMKPRVAGGYGERYLMCEPLTGPAAKRSRRVDLRRKGTRE